MFTRHISGRLAAYIDGELPPRQAQQAELHIERCASCRIEFGQVGAGMAMLENLPPVEAPVAIWESIEAALPHTPPRPILRWRFALVLASLVVLAATAYWGLANHSGMRREVPGEWIETDSISSVTVKIGEIGAVELAPGTRVRVVTARPDEHRMALAHGRILAKISAPPKRFLVDTPSGVAVDLGCEYTLEADDTGRGLLSVAKGWVSFQWRDLESLVPAGASCRLRPVLGPGIPYFDDAPSSVKQALDQSGDEALSAILAGSRVRDTLTLWHLISRVEVRDRVRVYDRIAALTPIPAGISRDQALHLDPETLRRWKDELAWTW